MQALARGGWEYGRAQPPKDNTGSNGLVCSRGVLPVKPFLETSMGGKVGAVRKKQTGGEAEVRMEDGEKEYELIWIKWMRIRSIYLELV